ncbi:MAG: phage tail tape measure protein [Deltaproteobacteria bacterium]|nr:phage tail tape measure protein [Deltaproteobacteria bacterium]
MANKIHITLEVDDKGTAKIKGFGGTADKAFAKIKKNATAGATQAGKMERAWGSATKKMKLHWKAYSAAAAVAMTAVAAAAIAGVSKSIGAFAGFEKEMANVSTLVDTSKVSMKGLEKGIMELPSALGSATELTKGLYQALSAGVKPAESIKFVAKAAMAAKAGLSDTFTAVDAGTTILNAFGMEASKAGEVYDLMFTTVKEGKTTFGELAAAVGKISPIASAANVSVVEMHAALATLTKGE